MSLAFPTTASTLTSSDLFPVATSTSTGGGNTNGTPSWFGGGGPSSSAYFQTVIISLVALAVLLIISVSFLYYRRRRLRMYAAADWPFADRGMGGGLFFPGANDGRNKESKDIGEKPDMWEVNLDDEKLGAVKNDRRADLSSEEREMRQYEEEKHGSLEHWQPLSITSLSTSQAAVSAGTEETTRPISRFTRGVSAGRVNIDTTWNSTSNAHNPSSTSSATTLPIHLTYIIAMPQPPVTKKPVQPTSAWDDMDGEDIPEVQLGTTIVDLDIPSALNTGTYPPPAPPATLSQALGMEEPSSLSLRDVLGLPAPVQRTRRERRREREHIGVR